jgi:tripartite-type tricarboxylate transporter receptor subunit TctC
MHKAGIAFLAVGLALAATCQAQLSAYPNRALRLVVPYTQGAGADLTGRIVGQKLSEMIGQSVVVENRPGANGILGTEAVLKSAAD